MQCMGVNKSGIRCSRKTAREYCYQHTNQAVNDVCEVMSNLTLNQPEKKFDVYESLRPIEAALNIADPNTLEIAQKIYDHLYVLNPDYSKLFLLNLYDYLSHILDSETDPEIDYLINQLLTELKY